MPNASLYLKHLVATSPAAPTVERLRRLAALPRRVRQPEMTLVGEEDRMMEAAMARLIAPDATCVDVGAHIGSVSWRMQRLAPRGRHFIVEASPTKAAWLRRRFPTATVFAAAASDRSGSVTFFEDEANPGFSAVVNGAGHPATGHAFEVPAITLDEALPADIRVDFIKIDVEGHEFSALRGGREMLGRDLPAILFEAGAQPGGAAANDGSRQMAEWLGGSYGYAIYPVFHFHFDRPPIALGTFDEYRRYPFPCFNYLALQPRHVAAARGETSEPR